MIGWHQSVTAVQQVPKLAGAEKGDPPGGDNRAGRVRHGVDEAPVSDAGSTNKRFQAKPAPDLIRVGTGSREENASDQDHVD
jgi:hypothetical protein